MRTTARSLVGKFHDIVDRMIATLHQQRAIEARRVLQRYRHLLEAQHETLPLNEIILSAMKRKFQKMPIDLMRASAPPATPRLERA